MADVPLSESRVTSVHLPAAVHRVPSKRGATWNLHNGVIEGSGCPRSHYTEGSGTRICGPTAEYGDQPAALLTLLGIGVTVRDLGFCYDWPLPKVVPAGIPVGLSVKLRSGTGKMVWSHLDFRCLKTGIEIGGDTANANCDQIVGEGLYFHDCQTAWHVRHSQAMLFNLRGVEINGCDVGFHLEQGCHLRAETVVFLDTPVGVRNGLDNPSVVSIFDHVAIDAQPEGGRMVLFEQPKYARSNFVFRDVRWPRGLSEDRGQPMLRVNHGCRVVFEEGVLPPVNLVEILDGGSAANNKVPAVVEFRHCGFWSGWSPAKAFPLKQRLGSFRVVFRDCYDRETLRTTPDIVMEG